MARDVIIAQQAATELATASWSSDIDPWRKPELTVGTNLKPS
jgi:hypothetical protein